MVKPSLSIVIPTHKRAAILKQTLEHLEQQTIADQLEVIVVSDGPDEGTSQLFNTTNYKLKTTNFVIEKSQQGVARNRGVEKATAPITLFLGDDCFLAPDACERHLKAHRSPLTAVLGFVTWDPAIGITPVMRWLETSGWQFGYPMIEQYAGNVIPSDMQARFTYTINISVPTEIARAHPFREDLSLYGWEDILWGQELADAGVRLLYEPQAKGLHHHRLDVDASLKRMETLGRSAVIIRRNDPSFDRLPQGWKAIAYRCMSLLPTMRGKHTKAFLQGIKNN